jgi:hypothetical protein
MRDEFTDGETVDFDEDGDQTGSCLRIGLELTKKVALRIAGDKRSI